MLDEVVEKDEDEDVDEDVDGRGNSKGMVGGGSACREGVCLIVVGFSGTGGWGRGRIKRVDVLDTGGSGSRRIGFTGALRNGNGSWTRSGAIHTVNAR